MMKIIFISGVKFGFDVLESILEKNWKITASFSYLPKKRNSIVIMLILKILQKNMVLFISK